MLASDSDSDFEYPADANDSDASSDLALKGQLALGVDPEEAKAYDGRSAPLNGSQYLMMVMKEKKTTPKVAYADAAKLPVKTSCQAGRSCDEKNSLEEKDFLEVFLKKCSMKMKDASGQVFDPSRWREDVISKFSLTRTKVEHWNYRIQSRELTSGFLFQRQNWAKLPPNNENLQWLRFCYGVSFSKLAASQKSRTAGPEQKLRDYFLDLYDEETSKKLLADDVDTVTNSGIGVDGDNENPDTSSSTDSVSSSEEAAKTKSDKSTPPITLGHKPVLSILMRLNQTQLENLIKWNLVWLKTYGFANQCQGQWIYSLFACLPKPIDPSVMSDLREIARVLINMRGADCWSAMMDQAGESAEEELLCDFINSMNLLVYIVVDYFQQKDLVMKL